MVIEYEQLQPAPPRRKWVGLGILALPTLLLSVDTSALYLAMPHLSRDLNSSSTEQLWIMDIYGFMLAGFLITMGNIGDHMGYRKLLLIGSAAFGVTSVLAAFSSSSILLIVARGLTGIAGATIMPSSLAIIRNMFPDPKHCGRAISIWMSCFMGGMIGGPLVGGTLLEHFWWGAVFLLSVPITLISVVAGLVLLPEYRYNTGKAIDGIGIIFSLLTILPFIYGVTEMSRSIGGYSPLVWMSTGLLFGVAFLYRERTAVNPLVDTSLFANRIFSTVLLAMLLTAVLMGGVSFYAAQYLQLVQGLSPLGAGLWMVPQAMGMILGSLLIPVLSRNIPAGRMITIGFVFSCIGMFIVGVVPAVNGLALLETGFVLAVIGAAPILILGTGIILGSAPGSKAGAAASLAETSNQFGVALGVALLGSIGNWVYHQQFIQTMPEGLSPSDWATARESLAGATTVAVRTVNEAQVRMLAAAKSAFVSGLHTAAYFGAFVFALLAWIAKSALSSAGDGHHLLKETKSSTASIN